MLVGSPFDSLYVEALCERGTFLRFQVYERVRAWLVEGYEGVGKSAIVVCERT